VYSRNFFKIMFLLGLWLSREENEVLWIRY
jgi:hypothetical protein